MRQLRSVLTLAVTTIVLGVLLATVVAGAIGLLVIAIQHALKP